MFRPRVLSPGLRFLSVSSASASLDGLPPLFSVDVVVLFSAATEGVRGLCVLSRVVAVSRGSPFAFCSMMYVPLSHYAASSLDPHNNLD